MMLTFIQVFLLGIGVYSKHIGIDGDAYIAASLVVFAMNYIRTKP